LRRPRHQVASHRAGRHPRSPGPGALAPQGAARHDRRRGRRFLMAHAAGRRVCVIGGGIAGLATATLLAADGWSVQLLEKGSDLGGRAGSWGKDGFRFDTGPSWYLMPEVFDHFFGLLGTSAAEQLDLRLLDPGYRVFFEGERQPLE